MSKDRSHLRLVPPPSEATLVLERLSSQAYNAGTRNKARDRRAEMLRHYYPHPDIPPTEIEKRMDRLRDDVLEAIETASLMTPNDFPFARIRALHESLWACNAIEEFATGDAGAEERVQKSRLKYFRELVEILWRSAARCTHREGVESWLVANRRTCPDDSDLILLAVAELNANRIGLALPRILVLPNHPHPFDPFYVHVDPSIRADTKVAHLLRLLFSG